MLACNNACVVSAAVTNDAVLPSSAELTAVKYKKITPLSHFSHLFVCVTVSVRCRSSRV